MGDAAAPLAKTSARPHQDPIHVVEVQRCLAKASINIMNYSLRNVNNNINNSNNSSTMDAWTNKNNNDLKKCFSRCLSPLFRTEAEHFSQLHLPTAERRVKGPRPARASHPHSSSPTFIDLASHRRVLRQFSMNLLRCYIRSENKCVLCIPSHLILLQKQTIC